MSIVRMKHIRLLGMEEDREKLLTTLQRLGCVQIDSQSAKLTDTEWAALVKRTDTRLDSAKERAALLQSALDTLGKYAKVKVGMVKKLMTARPEISMRELQNAEFTDKITAVAESIRDKAGHITDLLSEQGRLENKLTALQPWTGLDIPLETPNTDALTILTCVCPAAADIESLQQKLGADHLACHTKLLGSDSDQHYLLVLLHPSDEEEITGILKSVGYSRVVFKETTGTAAENISQINKRLGKIEKERKAAEDEIAEFAPVKPDLERVLDASNVLVQREEAADRLVSTGKAYYLEGWAPQKVVSGLEHLLDQIDCAYTIRDPEPEEEVPVLLHNRSLVKPFNMVTNMYALPQYNNIDPNPLMAPFYAIFFGMMFADVAYGLILLLLGFIITKKGKPKNMMGYAFKLMQICGVSTIVFGILFGGFFSDAVTVIGKTYFNADWVIPALWISPTDYNNNGPMIILVFSLALGMLQIITGMAVKGYLLIRDGQPLAAVLEILPWWVFFAAVGVTALTSNIMWLLISLGLIVLTQGYKKKSLVGKFFGGVVALYDITSYLSDVLSYSRLMALGLAGGVIGSVFNTLGAMPGTLPIVGPVLFIIIFVVGHLFNMAINIIGTYVHAARLQYIEYFSKFYEAGGAPFTPLHAQTKYVDVVEPKK